jgi:hypothetical protein
MIEMVKSMSGPKQRFLRRIPAVAAAVFVFAFAVSLKAQTPSATDATPAAPPAGGRQQRQAQDDNGERPVFGRITAIQDNAIKISKPDGTEETVTVTPKTEFRKDRQPAKLKDFKVGDGVLARGEENADHTFTAQMVVGRNGNGGGPNRQNPVGTLGKDFVMGEVKAIDAPSITVMRTDNVKQVFELTEDTSLRKGRESITMADILVGDHIFAHGELQENHFVPKTVAVIAPEQWKRMQEMGATSLAAGKATQQNGSQHGTAAQPSSGQQGSAPPDSAPNKPTEPPN